jgi:hypothetical protein
MAPGTVQLRVTSCSGSTVILEKKIAGKNYSNSETQLLMSSAESVSIIDTQVIADVELIESTYKGSGRTYKGRVTAVVPKRNQRYMLIGVSPSECEETYKGKVVVAAADTTPLRCCRDVVGSGWKETTSQCLLGLPTLKEHFGLNLDELQIAEIKVLQPKSK